MKMTTFWGKVLPVLIMFFLLGVSVWTAIDVWGHLGVYSIAILLTYIVVGWVLVALRISRRCLHALDMVDDWSGDTGRPVDLVETQTAAIDERIAICFTIAGCIFLHVMPLRVWVLGDRWLANVIQAVLSSVSFMSSALGEVVTKAFTFWDLRDLLIVVVYPVLLLLIIMISASVCSYCVLLFVGAFQFYPTGLRKWRGAVLGKRGSVEEP